MLSSKVQKYGVFSHTHVTWGVGGGGGEGGGVLTPSAPPPPGSTPDETGTRFCEYHEIREYVKCVLPTFILIQILCRNLIRVFQWQYRLPLQKCVSFQRALTTI